MQRGDSINGDKPEFDAHRAGTIREDCRLFGLSPDETRQAVIRSAVMSMAARLAQQQLLAPSPEVVDHLSRVATSAYRLLDPRQRRDPQHRVRVGRILPSAILAADGANFIRDGNEIGAVVLGDYDDGASLTIVPKLSTKCLGF